MKTISLSQKLKCSIFLFQIFITLNSFAQLNDSLVIKYNYVNSIPQNAEVYYNDTLIGYTPLRTFNKFTYSGIIKVKYKGYNDYVYSIQSTDTLLNMTFYMVPALKTPRQLLVTENKNSMFKKPRKVLPIAVFSAVSIGSAASAYYFKKLANDRYDDYLRNGEQDLLDKTKRYDLISGISLAVFQLGLIGVIYFLFIE